MKASLLYDLTGCLQTINVISFIDKMHFIFLGIKSYSYY